MRSMLRRAFLVVEVLAAYARARWIMGRRPLMQAAAHQRATKPTARPHLTDSVAEGRRLGRATLRVLRLVPTDSRCLVRALTVTRLLARRGLPNTLVIGVRSTPDFVAHAWVELDGIPVLPDGGEGLTRLGGA